MNKGRRIPSNRKPRACPDCSSNRMVKCGKNHQDKQVWKCNNCGVRTVHPKI